MFRFEKYVDYALNVPMYFVYRNGKYVNCAGLSFKVIIRVSVSSFLSFSVFRSAQLLFLPIICSAKCLDS